MFYRIESWKKRSSSSSARRSWNGYFGFFHYLLLLLFAWQRAVLQTQAQTSRLLSPNISIVINQVCQYYKINFIFKYLIFKSNYLTIMIWIKILHWHGILDCFSYIEDKTYIRIGFRPGVNPTKLCFYLFSDFRC